MNGMKIQPNLVWDNHSGQLIGFADRGDVELNDPTLEKIDEIATHILAFLIHSVINPFELSLASFTSGATSDQIFPLL